MSIFFPIGETGEAIGARAQVQGRTTITARGTLHLRGVAVVAGSTSIQAAGSVLQRHGARVEGRTTITARGTVAIRGSAQVQGGTLITARGRLDAPSGNLGAGVVAGSTTITATGTLRTTSGGAQVQGRTTITARGTVTTPEEFGFTFFLDILNASLAVARHNRYRVRLLADGVEVPITSFSLRAPRDAVGTSLSFQLAQPDTSLVSRAALLTFELGVKIGDGWQWLKLLDGGRMAGREAQIGLAQNRPADTVSISALDVLGDRWMLAPSRDTLFYDPAQVDAASLAFDTQNPLRGTDGAAIQPVQRAISNLSLHRVLDEAYAKGCGFASVVTNIPDYRVSQAQFSMQGGYHDGVHALVALYEPLYFAGDDNTLWIIDPDPSVRPSAWRCWPASSWLRCCSGAPPPRSGRRP